VVVVVVVRDSRWFLVRGFGSVVSFIIVNYFFCCFLVPLIGCFDSCAMEVEFYIFWWGPVT